MFERDRLGVVRELRERGFGGASSVRGWLRVFVHNTIFHPMLPWLPTDIGNQIHDRSGQWAYGERTTDPCSAHVRGGNDLPQGEAPTQGEAPSSTATPVTAPPVTAAPAVTDAPASMDVPAPIAATSADTPLSAVGEGAVTGERIPVALTWGDAPIQELVVENARRMEITNPERLTSETHIEEVRRAAAGWVDYDREELVWKLSARDFVVEQTRRELLESRRKLRQMTAERDEAIQKIDAAMQRRHEAEKVANESHEAYLQLQRRVNRRTEELNLITAYNQRLRMQVRSLGGKLPEDTPAAPVFIPSVNEMPLHKAEPCLLGMPDTFEMRSISVLGDRKD